MNLAGYGDEEKNPSGFFDFDYLHGTEICGFCHTGIQVRRRRAFSNVSR
jgi:hypothetical protein